MLKLSAILFVAASLSAQPMMLLTSGGSGATAATPTFSPVAGSISSGTTIAISTATSGCSSHIYWSFVHNPPTTSDTNSTTSSAITSTSTLYAKVIGCPGYADSGVGSASYTISGGSLTIKVVSVPVASIGGGSPASANTSNVDCSISAGSGFGPANYGVITTVGYTGGSNPTPNTFDSITGSGVPYTLTGTAATASITRAAITSKAISGANPTEFSMALADYAMVQGICLNVSGTPSVDTTAISPGGTATAFPLTMPSTTPAQTNEMVLISCSSDSSVNGASFSSTPPTGYTLWYNIPAATPGVNFAGAGYYKIKTDALAEAPVISTNASPDPSMLGACMMTFIQ